MRDPGRRGREVHGAAHLPAQIPHHEARQAHEICNYLRWAVEFYLHMLYTVCPFAGILALCDEFVPGDPPEYFFDKNPENFSAILEMHRR